MSVVSRKYLAIDIGASSGRHIIGTVNDGKIELKEMYRFENKNVKKGEFLCWDTQSLFGEIVAGMKACGDAGEIPDSVAIDTWGVDFVLLDEEGKILGETVAYRDTRTQGMEEEVDKIIPFDELYGRTGIQRISFNTIYQLMAIKKTEPELLDKADCMLFIPNFLNYLLTGVKMQEYTIASTAALLNAESKDWDMETIEKLGFNKKLFSKLEMPGTEVGTLLPTIREKVGFDTKVLLAASHDTASAYMSVPAVSEDSAYISSGTWSLLGIESKTPIISDEGRKSNFTNEGGYKYRYRFLKNIMGLWMIQSIRREYDKKYSFAQLEDMAKENTGFSSVIDVNDDVFMAPDSMVDAVKDMCRKTMQPVPETLGQLMQCVYKSLAKCYADAVINLEKLTGKKFTSINIVGGGSKDGYLNKLTADETGLDVYAGPTEGTVIGNLLAQMIEFGDFKDLEDGRNAVRDSFTVKKV